MTINRPDSAATKILPRAAQAAADVCSSVLIDEIEGALNGILAGEDAEAAEPTSADSRSARRLQNAEHRWIADSPAMQRVTQRIDRIAASDSTVLITGESGVGKSFAARRVHELSPRAERPFVQVNCASLPRDLIESELFGHIAGAFTGAIRNRVGRVQAADGGTLFLDEIGDLPIELQPKLLTFLQDRTFYRIGSNQPQISNVRIIAATHQNLRDLRERRRLRDDLYYRLNVLSLHVPPLRDRLPDLPTIAEEILRRKPPADGGAPALDALALEALTRHAWPGNIRELENVLERSRVYADTETISASDIVFDQEIANESSLENALKSTPPVTLDALEAAAIRIALERTLGNRAQAAKLLGISERGIYNKIKRFQALEQADSE